MRRIAELTGRPYAWFHADDDEPAEVARPSHVMPQIVAEALEYAAAYLRSTHGVAIDPERVA